MLHAAEVDAEVHSSSANTRLKVESQAASYAVAGSAADAYSEIQHSAQAIPLEVAFPEAEGGSVCVRTMAAKAIAGLEDLAWSLDVDGRGWIHTETDDQEVVSDCTSAAL